MEARGATSDRRVEIRQAKEKQIFDALEAWLHTRAAQGLGQVAAGRRDPIRADAHDADLAGLVAELRHDGATTLRALASALNARGILTRRGGQWHVSSVRNVLARLEKA
jgi:hypothetical protein